MRVKLFVLLFFCFAGTSYVSAQQKLAPGKMNYLIATKPNNILYRDTLYRGSKEFRQLFARTGDADLMRLYQKHQTTKILSQVLTFAGSFAIGFGIANVTSSNGDLKTQGWILIGSGFVAATYGGYLTLKSQQQLLTAVELFNSRHHTSGLGIGASGTNLGLVYKF